MHSVVPLTMRRMLSARSRPRASGKRFSSSSSSSTNNDPNRVSHGSVYTDLIPGMVPVALLGSAVYLGLRLAQTHLAHEKYLDEARSKIAALEEELQAQLSQSQNQAQTTILQSKNGNSSTQNEGRPTRRWWLF